MIGSEDQSQGDGGDGDFAEGADDEGARALLEEVLRLVRRPTPAKVSRNAQRLRLPRAASWGLLKPSAAMVGLVEAAESGEQRDEEEAEDELGELLPEEGCLVLELGGCGARLARPLRAHWMA